MPITRRYAHGLPYDSYSLHATRAVQSLADVRLWPGLGRPAGTNYGARRNPPSAPIRVCFQHIAVAREMRDPGTEDTSAEGVTAWGLNPANRGASWPDCVDRDSWVPYLNARTVRTWTQGVANPYGVDWNTLGWGQEMGIWDPNWDAKPDWYVEATLRMSAAAWAIVVSEFNIPLRLILDENELYRLATAHPTAPIGFSEHWVVEKRQRNDAGRWPLGGTRTTFPWHKRHLGGPGLFPMIQEELAIRVGTIPGTPNLPPAPSETVRKIQTALNDLGANLDADGYWGPLTEADARIYAGDYGYAGDVTDHSALLTHLEDTMSKIDELKKLIIDRTTVTLNERAAALTGNAPGRRLDLSQTENLNLILSANGWVDARESKAIIGGLEAAIESLAGQTAGVDVEAVKQAARDGAAEALAGRKFTGQVTLADLINDQED